MIRIEHAKINASHTSMVASSTTCTQRLLGTAEKCQPSARCGLHLTTDRCDTDTFDAGTQRLATWQVPAGTVIACSATHPRTRLHRYKACLLCLHQMTMQEVLGSPPPRTPFALEH